MTKVFLFQCFILLMICVSLTVFGIAIELLCAGYSFAKLFGVLGLFIAIAIIWIVLIRWGKRLCFGQRIVKPYSFDTELDGYNQLINKLESETNEKIMNMIQNDVWHFSYICCRFHGIKIRFLLSNTENFDLREYKRLKKSCNAKINKVHKIRQISRLGQKPKVRVNIIYSDTPDDFDCIIEYLSRNADELFSRVEPILNVGICGKKVYIPKHLGFSCFNIYYKVAHIVKQILVCS